MKPLDVALKLAAKLKPVFPCQPNGKKPLTDHGFKDATGDPEKIRQWWEAEPDANVAIATGVDSGVVVLDVDVDPEKGKNGEEVLLTLMERHEFLPVTLEVRTPRGGRHLYFRHPGHHVRIPCSTDKLGPDLDVRGDGGYVLVPPSSTERGEYTWGAKHDVADLPFWLLQLMIGTAEAQQSSISLLAGASGDDEERLRDALNHISADLSHDDWVRVLMALHSWDQAKGRELGRNWSASCPEKFRERDFEAAWRSFKANGGVGLGTLFEMARRHGWQPARILPKKLSAAKVPAEEAPELVLPKWPEPPRPEAFYGVLGEYVRRLEPHTESDPMAIMVQLIVAFGNIIGRTVHFVVEADKHFSNVNAVTVGNSSKARKGTSWGHVNRLLREVDKTWPRPLNGLSTGEGMIYIVRDPIRKPGRDGTDELVDAGINDKRVLCMESEFGRTLQCSNREGNTLSAVIRQAFDTGDLRVATKGSPQVATNAHISIIGHVTGIELNLLLTKNDSANGLANRFLWVAVRRSKLLPDGGQSAALDFSDIVMQLVRALDFASTGACITKDESARALWRAIYESLSVERPGLLGAIVSRAEALVLRIAMIFAVTDCSPAIQVRHLRAAVAVWDYCEASAAFIFGDSLGNALAERVLEMLLAAGEQGLSLARMYEGLSGHVEKDDLHLALRQLHSQGLVKSNKVQTSGRPRHVWLATQCACERSEKTAKKVAEANAPVHPPSGDISSLNSLNSPPETWEEIL